MKMFLLRASLVAISLFYCASAMAYDSAPIGWASMDGGTTGGAGGTTVTVDNATDFIDYVENQHQDPYIIYVSGNIDLGGSNVRVRGNKTIIGLPGSHISGNLKSYRAEEGNNIFRFLDMDNVAETGDGDCISIDGASHIWIDHCTFTNGGDGNIDIKNGADYITVSWCIFKYTFDSGHNYSNLIGHSDDNGDTDRNHLLITFHHNWYSTMCKERMPRVRFGQVHVYNNYYSDLLDEGYCIGVGVEANIRVENNYFNAVPMPWKDYYTGNGAAGHIGWNTENIFYNCTEPTWATNEYSTIFTPPYSYSLEDTNNIPAIVQYGAGADGNDGYPPHWFLSFYGDFDLTGLVDMNDLVTFVDYWLDTNDINDADYYDDGIIDGREFSLFAGNWLVIPPDTTAPDAPADLWALAGDETVSLDWADNSEPDLDGYNLYRSTTSGSFGARLNSSLLTDSNYIDDNVANGTIYYYVVTAVDTNENESGDSVEACALPTSDGNNVTVQENATGFCGVDGDVENEHSGYTGYGYANTDNSLGEGIDWRINVSSSGTYTFVWRYALESGNRTAKLIANGETVLPSISFPSTGAWTTYIEIAPVDANLTTGINDLRLEATTSDGLANIDYINMYGDDVTIESCP